MKPDFLLERNERLYIFIVLILSIGLFFLDFFYLKKEESVQTFVPVWSAGNQWMLQGHSIC